MLGFDRRSLKRISVPVELKIIIGSDFVSAITKDVTKKGMCIKLPISSLKGGILERLEEKVSLRLGETVLYGLIRWYNVENGTYSVGIKLERTSQAKWWSVVGPVAQASMSVN